MTPTSLSPRDMVGVALAGLRARRLRAGLSAAGIAIGIAAMVSVLGISGSSRAELLAELDELGTNFLTVAPGQTLFGDEATLSPDAVGMIRRVGPVTSAAATAKLDVSVYRHDHIPESESAGIQVQAADTGLLSTMEGGLRRGTFLNDASARYPSVVLGAVAAERLGVDRADGTVQLWLGRHWFTVVGILEPFALAPDIDRSALIGFATAAELFGHDGAPSTVYVRTTPEQVENVRAVLGRTARPEHPEEVAVSRPSDALAARAAADEAFTVLLLSLGGVALVVGGVGIANVMVVSVLERRSEIGLRRALGATRRHIRGQFLNEALLLSGLGGAAGVAGGALLTAAYSSARSWPVTVPLVAVGGGLAAALVVGGLSGLWPALRAARLSPTDALRSV